MCGVSFGIGKITKNTHFRQFFPQNAPKIGIRGNFFKVFIFSVYQHPSKYICAKFQVSTQKLEFFTGRSQKSYVFGHFWAKMPQKSNCTTFDNHNSLNIKVDIITFQIMYVVAVCRYRTKEISNLVPGRSPMMDLARSISWIVGIAMKFAI